MATNLGMTLDYMVKRSKRERGRGQGGARRARGEPGGGFAWGGRMAGPTRKGPLGVNARPSQHQIAKPSRRTRNFPWQQDFLEDSIRSAGLPGIEIGTKLNVTNLDSGVTNEDIRELFSDIGEMKRYAIHYDKNGRPSGSAEIIYSRRSDAFSALKKYNNVLLDGKPMKVEIVGANAEIPVSARANAEIPVSARANAEIPVSARVNVTGLNNGRRKRTVVMTLSVGVPPRGPAASNRGFGQSRRAGMRGGRGRGSGPPRRRGPNGRGKKKPVEKSAAELDKELENYHADAMQT